MKLLTFISTTALLTAAVAYAGGPKYVAGASYFNPAILGQPVVWANGQVQYFVDQGPLGTDLSNTQAVAMVDAAAQVWNAIPTAAVNLIDSGPLAEDVNGSNVLPGIGQSPSSLAFAAPADVTPTATGTPVAVIFDSDGSVIDALEGVGASQPDNCEQNGVLVWIDNFNPNATFAHGVIVLNGRCASSANLQTMMSYQLERAFGRILGLDFSQVNDNALNLTATEPNATLAWPVMQPINSLCGPLGGDCIPSPNTLHWDDIAVLNRLYPVTQFNLASFPGKQLTAANTVSLQGTVSFSSGEGMQGVNVVARPLDSNGNSLYQYTVTFVSGSYFAGNHGNPVTGFTDNQGNRYDRFGGNDPSLQGSFDLSGIPLPPGVTSANFEINFEPVNPLYVDAVSVGPYILGSPEPSGTLASLQVSGLSAGSARNLTIVAANSASDLHTAPRPVAPILSRKILTAPASHSSRLHAEIASESSPLPLPATGQWTSRLDQIGQSDWLLFPVRGNRIFTVVTQALDENGTPTARKAMPALGVWDGFAPIGTAPAGATTAQNGLAPGETWLQVATAGNDIVRLGIADQRGDGRPDYLYRGWVLYADTVSPARLPASGGVIVIRGTGFRTGDTVQIGGVLAQVLSILPNEITALAPPAGTGVTGSQDVEVDDLPTFSAAAVIPSGVSYDSATGDGLSIVVAPANQVPLNVPQPFTILAKGADGNPAGGVTVTYALTSGTATLGCGQSICSVTATGDGYATLPITATSASVAVVSASLTNGASVQAHFYAGTPAAISTLTPTLYLAAGSTIQWPVQALLQSAGSPSAGQGVTWKSATGIAAPTTAAITNAAGVASATLTVGPLAEGQTATTTACLTGTSSCATFTAFGSRPEYATLAAVSGTSQSLPTGSTPAPVVLRLLDMNGNPMAGGTVTVSQSLYAWTPVCARHSRCAQPQLLSTQSSSLTSALDGSVTLTPLTLADVATNLQGLAATGNTASLSFNVELYP